MDSSVVIVAPAEAGMTESDLCRWLGAAAPGDQLVYHQGFLAADLEPTSDRLTPREKERLRRVARRAMLAAEAGLVHLLQRRLGPGDYSYFLVARPRPSAKSASLEVIFFEGADAPSAKGSRP